MSSVFLHLIWRYASSFEAMQGWCVATVRSAPAYKKKKTMMVMKTEESVGNCPDSQLCA